jgi:methylated-DNA-[protein]-cysteine S-methyltransferase
MAATEQRTKSTHGATRLTMPDQNNTRSDGASSRLVACGVYDAPRLSTLWLGWSDAGLAELRFARGKTSEPFDRAVPRTSIPERFREPLDRYFAGEREDFQSVRLDLEGTRFQRRVWDALRRIPHGEVRSYSHIAAAIGSPRAMRAVGMANAKNPVAIIVPCHRVVEAGSRLGGYSAGLERKRALLALEGVKIERDRVHPGQLTLL